MTALRSPRTNLSIVIVAVQIRPSVEFTRAGTLVPSTADVVIVGHRPIVGKEKSRHVEDAIPRAFLSRRSLSRKKKGGEFPAADTTTLLDAKCAGSSDMTAAVPIE